MSWVADAVRDINKPSPCTHGGDLFWVLNLPITMSDVVQNLTDELLMALKTSFQCHKKVVSLRTSRPHVAEGYVFLYINYFVYFCTDLEYNSKSVQKYNNVMID